MVYYQENAQKNFATSHARNFFARADFSEVVQMDSGLKIKKIEKN